MLYNSFVKWVYAPLTSMDHEKAPGVHLGDTYFSAERINFEGRKDVLRGGEVYVAGTFGALLALQAVLSMRQIGEKIFVLLNNQAVVIALRTRKSSSRIMLTKLFHSLAISINAEFRWVPAHSKVRGSREVDVGARAALQETA